MRTVTLDILDDKALNLLKDLESLNVIRLHSIEEDRQKEAIDRIKKLEGLMSKQPIDEINRQLNDLHNEWD